jgi:hypothetical protein
MPAVPLSSQFYQETQGLNTDHQNIERKSLLLQEEQVKKHRINVSKDHPD